MEELITIKQLNFLIVCLVVSVLIYITNELKCGYIMNYSILGIGCLMLVLLGIGALFAEGYHSNTHLFYKNFNIKK